MPRARIQLPDAFSFHTELAVRISDINYGGHLGNDAVLALAHEARMQFLTSMGYSETNIEGVGLIMTDAVVVYHAEAFHGDVLAIDVAVDDVREHRFDLFYRISRPLDGREIARVKTGMALYDYEKKAIGAMSDSFRQKLLKRR